MGKHKLDGGGEVEVTSVNGTFGKIEPRMEGSGRDRVVTFSQPTGAPITSIKFKFKTTGNNSAFMFGIKQISTPREFQALYAGLKDIDGSISLETKGLNDNHFLDITPASLTVLFDARNSSTGSTARAPHAPFFSELPMSVHAGTEVELGIVDGPGETFRMELQNGATDRPNFLARVNTGSEFVTALVAAKFDGTGRAISHAPIEGVRWRVKTFANVTWNGNVPTLERPVHESTKVEDLQTISSDSEFDVLRNLSLTAADCIVQKFNDGLYSARGQFEAQNFNRPTGHLTAIGSKGVIYIQFPVVAN